MEERPWVLFKPMSDKKFLGIDGGGTKTAFTLIDEKGTILHQFVLGGTAFDTYSDEKILSVFSKADSLLASRPDYIFAGIGGILSPESKKRCNALLTQAFQSEEVDSDNDSMNALYGVSEGEDGIIAICGTGSVAFGKKGNAYARSGGYCYQEGDLGSSYDIGRKALQHLGKTLDGREEPTALSKLLQEKLDIQSQIDFAEVVSKLKRDETASLAKLVSATQEEPISQTILKQAGDEIFAMVDAVYRRLKINAPTIFGIIGSLGQADTHYRVHLLERIQKELPLLKLSKKEDAALGSALKARELGWNGSSQQ